MYTLFFLANIEHWYDIPLEHSNSDMDYLLNNILTLVAAHIVLISAVLKHQLDINKTAADLDDIYDSNLVVICRYIGSIILQMAVLPKLN